MAATPNREASTNIAWATLPVEWWGGWVLDRLEDWPKKHGSIHRIYVWDRRSIPTFTIEINQMYHTWILRDSYGFETWIQDQQCFKECRHQQRTSPLELIWMINPLRTLPKTKKLHTKKGLGDFPIFCFGVFGTIFKVFWALGNHHISKAKLPFPQLVGQLDDVAVFT